MIATDPKDAQKTGNTRNIKDIKDVKETRYIKNVREIEYAKNIKDNKIIRCNNRLSDSKNKNNQHATIEDIINNVTDIVDPINKIFAKVLIYFFGSSITQIYLAA